MNQLEKYPTHGQKRSKKIFSLAKISVTLALVIQSGLCLGLAERADAQDLAPRSVWDNAKRGAFVMSSHYDGSRYYWFGTEDFGVWRYDPQSPETTAWKQFTVKDGLGDDHVYAIAHDKQGRIWVGHQNHGVSVWNGQGWKNYDILNGPLGERVFDIAVNPVDGNVWIGTNRGISIYQQKEKTWRYEGRWTGLSSDQVSCIAFDSLGTAFVGTQCDGLLISTAQTHYSKWDEILGSTNMPLFATGVGLPSNLINDIVVGQDETVYVATGYGLARSVDGGKSFVFLRGKDWKDKIKGLTFPPPIPDQPERDLLLEDTVTSIAEDSSGHIWLGHPSKGVEFRSPGANFLGAGGVATVLNDDKQLEREQTFEEQLRKAEEIANNPDLQVDENGNVIEPKSIIKKPQLSQEERADYVTSILPISGEAPLICGYGSGVIQLGSTFVQFQNQESRRTGQLQPSSFPAEVSAPLPEDLISLQDEVINLHERRPEKDAAFLGEDWNTKGDWVGRYGRRYAFLGGMQAPFDQYVINDPSYRVVGRLGIHPTKDGKTPLQQGLRHWVHRTHWDDARVLWNPLVGYRREAEIDDNGEVYPQSYEGPDIWVGFRLPEGVHRVSLYFFNKDGHDGSNRARDYIIDVKRGNEDIAIAESYPSLARSRVKDFWGGVHKQFLVRGPGDYYAIVRKNNSFNAILQSVMIDKYSGPKTRFEKGRDVWLGSLRYEPPSEGSVYDLEQSVRKSLSGDAYYLADQAIMLWNRLDTSYDFLDMEKLDTPARILAYRALASVAEDQTACIELLKAWRWDIPIRFKTDQIEFAEAMAKGWKSFEGLHPKVASEAR